MQETAATSVTSAHLARWPYRLAVVLACATFPLIWVGGLVTTYDAGMAVPDWPTTYGYNLFLYPWQTWLSGPFDLFIEHGHRLLGAFVGLISMALAIVAWAHPVRTLRSMSVITLCLVVAQGILGGLRVRLNAVGLAQLHGCVGPAFFAWCVGLVVWCRALPPYVPSRSAGEKIIRDEFMAGRKLLGIVWLLVAMVYGQLVLGSFLRHVWPMMGPGLFRTIVVGHITGAGIVAVAAIYLAIAARRLQLNTIRWPLAVLLTLITLQIALGAGTWGLKYGWPTFLLWLPGTVRQVVEAEGFVQSLVVTGHVAVGSLILASAVWIAMQLTCEPSPSLSSSGGADVPVAYAMRGRDSADRANRLARATGYGAIFAGRERPEVRG